MVAEGVPHVEAGRGQRLRFLDGIRALAALYVVLYHTYIIYLLPHLTREAASRFNGLTYGAVAVAVFITLSGYCLGLAAGRGDSQGKTGEFFRRRAIRILPPYFAALTISLLIGGGNRSQILAHVFLVQDLRESWSLKSNYVFWSIAVECQFYLLFPMLFACARRSAIRAALVGFVLSGLGIVACGILGLSMSASPWLLIPFTAGILLALYPKPEAPWGLLTTVLLAVFVAVEICLPTGATYGSWGRQALREILGAAVTIGVIATCRKSPNGVVCRTLSMRALVFAGVMSYSLYLIHAPVLRVVHLLTPHILIIGIPAALAVAYVFYLLVEKPCIALNRKRSPAAQSNL